MNPKAVAGIAGAAGLAVLGLVGTHLQAQNRAKRDLTLQATDDDYEVEMDFDGVDFEDEWALNNTNLWKQFNKDLGVELVEDDVMIKQDDDDDYGPIDPRARGKGKKVNWNRLKENSLVNLQDAMQTEYTRRVDSLGFFNEISGVQMGMRDPSQFGTAMNDEGDYSGYDKTAPVVQSFLNAFNCKSDGTSNFIGAKKTNVWIMFPGSVPLTSSSGNHLSDWANYWEFAMKFAKGWPKVKSGMDFRFSIGTYGASAKFTPRGYKLRNNTPFARMSKYYKKPPMNAAQPRFFASLRGLLTYLPRYGVSTATAGDNCVLVWFFQDVPRDINDFMVPEEFEMVKELHSMCTVIPVIVGPNSGSRDWQNFAANIMPGLQTKFAKDPDYNGVFNVESYDDLTNEDFHAHLNNYLCLVENRASCRTYVDAWQPPASEMSTGGDPTEGFRGLEEDYDAPSDAPAGTDAVFGTEASTAEPTTQKIPEIDSCCGHNGPTAVPFDSELRTCCEDGSVRAYEYEGDDPCLAGEFFK